MQNIFIVNIFLRVTVGGASDTAATAIAAAVGQLKVSEREVLLLFEVTRLGANGPYRRMPFSSEWTREVSVFVMRPIYPCEVPR